MAIPLYLFFNHWNDPAWVVLISSQVLKVLIHQSFILMMQNLSPHHLHRGGGCDYRVDLYDSFGDGWNGCSIDVLVDGAVVLDNITLASGSGPVTYYFSVPSGAGSLRHLRRGHGL